MRFIESRLFDEGKGVVCFVFILIRSVFRKDYLERFVEKVWRDEG